MLSPAGTLIGGSVEQVAEKLRRIEQQTGATRFVGQIDIGGQSSDEVAEAVKLFAGAVTEAVK
jgi:hypothetical protein